MRFVSFCTCLSSLDTNLGSFVFICGIQFLIWIQLTNIDQPDSRFGLHHLRSVPIHSQVPVLPPKAEQHPSRRLKQKAQGSVYQKRRESKNRFINLTKFIQSSNLDWKVRTGKSKDQKPALKSPLPEQLEFWTRLALQVVAGQANAFAWYKGLGAKLRTRILIIWTYYLHLSNNLYNKKILYWFNLIYIILYLQYTTSTSGHGTFVDDHHQLPAG